MLNRALRMMDFFIGDLHQHIKQLHQQQFAASHKSNQHFTVYRGQGMNEEDFKKMVANTGGLLSFNNFFSTSKNRLISLDFAKRML